VVPARLSVVRGFGATGRDGSSDGDPDGWSASVSNNKRQDPNISEEQIHQLPTAPKTWPTTHIACNLDIPLAKERT